MDRRISSSFDDGLLTLAIRGSLNASALRDVWEYAFGEVDRLHPSKIVVDASGIDYCDSAGAVLFAELRRRCGGNFEVRSLRREFVALVDMFKSEDLAPLPVKGTRSFVEEVGRAVFNVWNDLQRQITFVGELVVAIFWALRHWRRVPWQDAVVVAETAGVNALPIVALIGFLLGLIMAFQSAIPMQQFGAEIFVADLLGISMLKELGPLMTAIILAGRSGSAFAAELGTMKVNEEIDALTTMGLDPVRFLVVTRVSAAVAMTPLLSAFCSVFALAGGALVMMSMGYPLVTYVDRVVEAVSLSIFLAGLIKALAFAILVAGVGCLRGLATGTGAKAVGDSTTSAVVSAIILIAVVDAVFAVVFYSLGI